MSKHFIATRQNWMTYLPQLEEDRDFIQVNGKADLTIPVVIEAMRAQGYIAESTRYWDECAARYRVTEHGSVIAIQRKG